MDHLQGDQLVVRVLQEEEMFETQQKRSLFGARAYHLSTIAGNIWADTVINMLMWLIDFDEIVLTIFCQRFLSDEQPFFSAEPAPAGMWLADTEPNKTRLGYL